MTEQHSLRDRLPDPATLRERMRSMAILDAILCPNWDGRYFSFDARWADGEVLGSARNGQGDELFALFNAHGCFLKGFVHDSPEAAAGMRPDEHYRSLPAELASRVREPAFRPAEVTFCLWRLNTDSRWHQGVEQDCDADGSAFWLSLLDGDPETYRRWAEDYYEQDVAQDAVQAVFDGQPLTSELVRSLNPDVTLALLYKDLQDIRYPVADDA